MSPHPYPFTDRRTTADRPTDRPADGPADRPAAGDRVRDEHRRFDWWHHSHPTFAALTGFFAGMVFITAVPGGFAGVLRLLFPYGTAERLFPWVTVFLAVPLVLLAVRKTRRFAQFMWVGMVLTALVVLGVASLALYFMVQMDR